jgi:FtsP/CotA-like multicopper oxidase with cupredoxin domain
VLRRWSRRSFIEGTALCGVAALAPWAAPAAAGAQARVPADVRRQGRTRGLADALRGSEFDLTIDRTPVNVTSSPETALTINGSLPAPPRRWRQGDGVTIRVDNRLDEDASIHWHGIVLPANMDGVPGLSFHGIPARGSFTYRFPVRQAGTYWYHSHSGFQEQRGLYGPLIIDPIEPEPFAYDREHIVMLTDWTDEDPTRVFGRLKKQSNYYNR